MGAAHLKLTQPPKPPKYSASFDGLFWIDGGTHRIPAKFYEYKSTTGERAYWTFLYCSTHDEDLGEVSNKLNVYKEAFKVDILSFDYCGFGLHQCSHKPSESLFCETLQSVFNWLKNDKEVAGHQIILMGKGLGTGPIIEFLANFHSKNKPKKRNTLSFHADPVKLHNDDINQQNPEIGAVVLQSPMASLNSISAENFEGESTPRHDAFVNSKKILQADCPILIAHGTDDKFVPFTNFLKFKKSCSKKPSIFFQEIQGKGHHGLDYDDDFLQAILDFLNPLLPSHIKPAIASTPESPKKQIGYVSPEEQLRTEWLNTLQLEHLASMFIMGGFFDLDSILGVDKETLESLGVKRKEDQVKILEDLAIRKKGTREAKSEKSLKPDKS